MKIWFARNSFETHDRIQREFQDEERVARKRGGFSMTGISYHLARFPNLCEDCGLTYWVTDEHSYFHKGCPAKKPVGF